MDQIVRILLSRLTDKGMEPTDMPRFFRDFVNSMSMNPAQSLSEINQRLDLLGWYDLELDDYTFQLILAAFEQNLDRHASGQGPFERDANPFSHEEPFRL